MATLVVALLSGALFVVSAQSSEGTDLRPGRYDDLASLTDSEADRAESLQQRVAELQQQVQELADARRYNLQETLAHAVFERVAAARGVRALRVRLSKADVYPDAAGVGVEVASFAGAWPES